MPALITSTKFVKDGTAIAVQIEGPWWDAHLFAMESENDGKVNREVYEALRDALEPLGFKEVDA